MAWNEMYKCQDEEILDKSPSGDSHPGVVWVRGIPYWKGTTNVFFGAPSKTELNVLHGAMWWA